MLFHYESCGRSGRPQAGDGVMNPAPVFDRVYASIRDRIAAGQWRPGQRIELAALCDLLDASPSPVRDALHRLRGERLLMDGDGDGFCMPSLTEADLIDRYDWVQQLLLAGLQGAGRMGPVGESIEPVEATGVLFEAIVDAARNVECREAMGSMNLRLHPVRRAELSILDGVEEEVADLRRAVLADDRSALRRRLARYRRRRMRTASAIVYKVHKLDRRTD
ncbi:GntR family transcriptional regulator [Sphingomonas glacialis]|nr:GntR family transcriptional regulator [Sphingomonas glacialis]